MGPNFLRLKHSFNTVRWCGQVSKPCPKEAAKEVFNNDTRKCKVLVVGGGTGGCCVAARLARKIGPENVAVLEPSAVHYYQPMFALIAVGLRPHYKCQRPTRSVLPRSVWWIQDHADKFDPASNLVYTKGGKRIQYEYMVVALGLKNDYNKIPGLTQALNCQSSGVSTIYSSSHCVKTWDNIQKFKGGHAIFTFPRIPGKCPGAAQKIMYLSDDYWRMKNKRNSTNITYNTGGPVLFGIEKYAKELRKVVKDRYIAVNYCMDLVALDDGKAVFEVPNGKLIALPFNFLHVTPPMSPPACLMQCEQLVDSTRFLSVDRHTLQHTTFKNVYGIGDCTNAPNSKTAAAIAVQGNVVECNLISTMKGEKPTHKYNGYSACPMMTSFNGGIICEFIYDKKICETFPFDQGKEGRLVVYMNKYVFPYLYWNKLLKGTYDGTNSVRKIINPLGKCG